MIDLHCHILPGIDDGSKDPETTRQMLEEQLRQGVQTIVATPHFQGSKAFPREFLEKRAAALQQVSNLEGDLPRIIPGAEVEYFFGMGNSESLKDLQLGDSGLLLIEMPFCPWSQRMVEEVCSLKDRLGVTPVLAHVDRYRRRKQFPKYREFMLKKGVLFQCNASAFLSIRSRRWALQLLKKESIHFLGSDAHNLDTRAPNLDLAAQVIAKKLGPETMEKITAFTAEMLKI